MFKSLEMELQKDLIAFCKAEEESKSNKPLKASLIAEILRQIVIGDREITGLATNPVSGDVFVRFSFTPDNE